MAQHSLTDIRLGSVVEVMSANGERNRVLLVMGTHPNILGSGPGFDGLESVTGESMWRWTTQIILVIKY